MYLIDTNIIIWVIRGNEIYEQILQRYKDQATLSISTITIAEIHKNLYPTEITRTEEVLGEFEIHDVTESIAKQGGRYWQQYIKKFRNLHILDCLVAATAKEHDLHLLTLNTRHFPMKDILISDPLKLTKN